MIAGALLWPALGSAAGSIQATEGAPFSGQVGTGNACALSATIDWGDGMTSSGTLGSGGSISGSHTYAEEGSYNGSFHWTCDTPGSGSGSFTATVADAALSAAGSPVSATAGEGFNATVATFTDADPAGTTSDYAARIDWGDGSSSMGTVASSGSSFTVGGSHEYTAAGSFPTAVTITDGGGASAVGRGTATVRAAPSGVRAVFSVSPGGPLEVSQPLVLDGAASTGHGLRYRWDLDGSGKFATDSGATPSVQTTFATAGAHRVSLRVTDSHGAQSTSSETLRIGAGPDYTIKINPGNPRPGQEVHFSVRLLRLATAGGRAVASTAALPAGTVASIGFGDAPGRTYPYLGRYLTRGVQLSTSGEFSHRYQTGGRHVVDVRVVDRAGGSAGITVSFGAGTAAGDHAAGAHAAACCGGAIQAVGIAYSGGLAGRPTAFTADVYPSTVPTGGGAACDVAAGAAGCRHASAAATRSIVLNFPEGVVLGHPLICGLLPPSRDASAHGGPRARVADNNPPPPGTLFQHDEFVWNLGDTAGSDFCNPNTVDTNQDPNRVDTDTVLHTYHREGIYTISVLVKRRDHALGDKLISSFPASLTVPMITPVCHPIGIFKRSAFTGYLVESGDGCFTPATELGFAPDGGWEAYTTASGVPVTVLGLTLSGSNGPYGGVVVDPHTGFIGDRAPLLYPNGGGAICGQLQTGAVGVQALRCNRDPQITLTRGTTVLDGFEGAPAVLGLPRSAPPHVTLNGAGPYDPHNPPNTSVFHVRLPAPLGTSIDVDNLAAGEADSDFTLDGNTGALLPTGTPSQSGLGHAANFTVGPLPPIPFGPLTLSNFTITHEDNPAPGAPAWHGGGDVTFLPGGPQLNADDNVAMQTGIGIGANGGLLYAGAKADPLPVPIPIPPFFLLTGLGASFGPSPFHIQATGHATDDTGSLLDITGCLAFVVGQRTGAAFPFCDRGSVVDDFQDVRIRMSGHVTVADFLPIDAFLEIDQNPFQVHLGGHFHKDFSPVPVALDATVEGDFYANPFRFFLGAQGRIEQSVICAPVLGCPDIGSASGAVSSRGAELCGGLFGADLGGYVLWSPFKVGLFFDCSEGFSKVAIARDAAVNGDSSRATVTVSPGHPKVVLEVRGRSAAPRLTLISPGGQHSVDHGTNHLSAGDPVDFVEMPKLDTTLVLIRHAHAGTYTVTSGVGAIASATLHYQSPPISVSARVTGHGRPRTLHYRIRNLVAGASVTFVEQRPDHVLGVARSADGAITFSSADGPGGSRPIVAVLERGGLTQRVIDVTTYVAEPTPPLAAPRRLRATLHGHLLTVTWGGVPGARRYRVVVTFARGAAIVHEVRASADRYATLIPGSASTVSVTVATIGTPAQRGGSAVLTLRNLIRRRPALL